MPQGVEVVVTRGEVRVKGPKGQLVVPVSSRMTLKQGEGELLVERPSDNRLDRAQHGLARSLVANAVTGVTEGFSKQLEIQGVGYRCALRGQNLELSLGFSHPVVVEPPPGISFTVPEPVRIIVSGIDKQLVGQVAANIRKIRSPDAYHGKGVRYQGEHVRLKPGKAASR